MAYLKDLTGNKYGRLTVIEFAGNNKQHNSMWKCKCDCGKEVVLRGYSLTSGHTQSCGCYNIEKILERNHKHGLRSTRLYTIHFLMVRRCENPNTDDYKNYGARGITVCDSWKGKNGFINFYKWSMEHGYKNDLTIDRIDNNKGYSPDNCRWVTREVQNNNRRNTRYVTVNGETDTVSRLARKYEIPYETLLRYSKGRKIDKYSYLNIEVVT